MTEPTRAEKCLAKCRVLGKTEFDFDGAHYVIDGSKVLLQEVYVTEGEFTIPEIVTGIYELGTERHYESPFINCRSVKVINHSLITDMYRMFFGCTNLLSLDLSEFDTSKVTDMGEMFSGCTALESIDLTGFNTSGVTDMDRLIKNCKSLSTLKIDINTHNVERMDRMFFGCVNLEHLSLNFDTRKVYDMEQMFSGCEKLKRLSLNFDTKNLKNMSDMFSHCYALEELELSDGFFIPATTDIARLFRGCESLKRIIMKGTPICLG